MREQPQHPALGNDHFERRIVLEFSVNVVVEDVTAIFFIDCFRVPESHDIPRQIRLQPRPVNTRHFAQILSTNGKGREKEHDSNQAGCRVVGKLAKAPQSPANGCIHFCQCTLAVRFVEIQKCEVRFLPFKIELPRPPTLASAMVSEKYWSIEAVARLFLGVIATLCCGMFLAGILEKIKLGLSADQLEFVQMILLIAFFQGAALLWIAVFLRQSNMSWRAAFGLRPPSRVRAVAFGLAVGVMVLPVVWLLQWCSESVMEWLHFKPVAQAAVTELQGSSLSVLEKILFGVFTIVLAPIAEEALFRGVLYPTIKQAGHPRWALWGTSVLFGVMHFNMATLAPLVFLALLLALLYESSDSLLTPIATHSMFNAANFFYLIFGDQINRLLHVS
jgi:membrane protease YdiL (CAAX protease family)